MISKRILYLFLLEYTKTHFIRTIFSLLGISLGVALFLSTTFNGRRAEKSLIDFSLGYLQEEYHLKIFHTNPQRGIKDEEISKIFYNPNLLWITKLSPRIQKIMYWKNKNETYQIVYLGVDIIKESNRKIHFNVEDSEEFIFASSALKKIGLKDFDQLEYEDKKISLSKLKFFDTEGGLVLLEDFSQFQKRLSKTLPYSYILGSVSQDFSKEKLNILKKFLYQIDQGLEVETKEDILQRSENALKSFHLNLIIISMISVIIAFFMVSNTMTGIFYNRKREMGVLRCLGISNFEMLQLFLAQGFVLGCIGTLFGIILGMLFTKVSFFSGESTVTNLEQTLSYQNIPKDILLYSVFIGIFGSLISSFAPAYRSSKISPLSIVREQQEFPQEHLNLFFWFLFGLFLVLIAYPVAQIPFKSKFPIFGLLGIGMIVIGQTLQFPYLFQLLTKLVKKFLQIFDKSFLGFRIGIEELFVNSSKNTLTAATLMLATSLVLSLSILTDSYKTSIISWTEREFPFPDSIVNKKDIEEGIDEGVSKEIYNQLETLENISAIDVFYLYPKIEVGNKIFTIHSYNFNLAIEKEKLRFGTSTYPSLEEKDILISTNMAFLHGYQIGDKLPIATKLGKQEFTIRGFREHFFSENGTIMMDSKVFEKYFQPQKYRALRIDYKDFNKREETLQAVNKILNSYSNLIVLSSSQLKELYVRGTEKVFQVLNSLKYTACLIAGIALFSAILYGLESKLKIFSMIRCIGGSLTQIGSIVFFEVLFLVLAGIIAGILCAIYLGPIILNVINKNAFGWSLPTVYPYFLMFFFLFSSPFLAFFLTLYPVYILKSLSLRKILSYE